MSLLCIKERHWRRARNLGLLALFSDHSPNPNAKLLFFFVLRTRKTFYWSCKSFKTSNLISPESIIYISDGLSNQNWSAKSGVEYLKKNKCLIASQICITNFFCFRICWNQNDEDIRKEKHLFHVVPANFKYTMIFFLFGGRKGDVDVLGEARFL